jgi:hypothetical protein
MRRILPLLACLLLTNCGEFSCQNHNSPIPAPDIAELLEPLTPAKPLPTPAPIQPARPLKTPHAYALHRRQPLSAGVTFYRYETKDSSGRSDPMQSLRVVRIDPAQLHRLRVLFSDRRDYPLSLTTVSNRSDLMAAMNWVFFGRIPGGDILGHRCQDSGVRCIPGSYTRSRQRTGKRTDLRYTTAVTRNGRVITFRGPLEVYLNQLRIAMGGGVLLFNQSLQGEIFRAVGQNNYIKLYLSGQYNEASIVSKGAAGDPTRRAPRSAMGVLPDGSLLYINVGEGHFRFRGGVTPSRLALIMKGMGCREAIMYDGGGAPTMAVKNYHGEKVEATRPERTATSDYSKNYSFLTIVRPGAENYAF